MKFRAWHLKIAARLIGLERGGDMRGADDYSETLFTTVRLEDFVPADRPLRPIRAWVNESAKMDAAFNEVYAADAIRRRPRIPPEKLVRAMLLQVLYSVRSERQLVEQIRSVQPAVPLVHRLSIDDSVWKHSVFSKNRERLLEADVSTALFNATVE